VRRSARMSEAPAPCAEYCKPLSAVNLNGRYLAGNSGYRGPGVASRFGPVPDVAGPEGAVGHAESYHESPCVESVGIIHAHISNPLTGSAPRPQVLCICIADLVFHDYRLWRGATRTPWWVRGIWSAT
jgi:hypothetical protein